MRGKFAFCNTVGTFCFRHLVERAPEARIDQVIQLDAAHTCDVCVPATEQQCTCCYGLHAGPCCPGWFHGDNDHGPEINACDECGVFKVDGASDDDAAQAAHDSVCACNLNERTRRKLSARPDAAPWIAVHLEDYFRDQRHAEQPALTTTETTDVQPDPQSDSRIYVACLSSYNAGSNYGAWIDIHTWTDEDDVDKAIAKMLAASKHQPAEDWAIHDTEGCGDDVAGLSIADIVTLVHLREDYGEDVVNAARSQVRTVAEVEGVLENFVGTFDSRAAFGESVCPEVVPTSLVNHINWDSYVSDLEADGSYTVIDDSNGVIVFRN